MHIGMIHTHIYIYIYTHYIMLLYRHDLFFLKKHLAVFAEVTFLGKTSSGSLRPMAAWPMSTWWRASAAAWDGISLKWPWFNPWLNWLVALWTIWVVVNHGKPNLLGCLEPRNFMTFHSVGNFIIPTDALIFFQRGRYTTNQLMSTPD